MINSEDIELLKHLISQSDNQAAYTRLYNIYFTSLLKFATSLVHSTVIAEEIVSDVLLQLWHKRKEVGKINNLTVYLFTCIRNHSFNHLGSKNNINTFSVDNEVLKIAGSHPDPEQACISSETIRALERAVNMLPPKCRMIFKLVKEDGLKYREVADLLDISLKTVEAQVGIAMKKLAAALHEIDTISKYPVLKVVS